jgi:hypothetical protein
MTQTVRFLALLMAVIYGSSAFAVVDPYEVMQITPAEGEVTSLQHFTITFDGLPVVVSSGAIPTLQKGGGATYEGSMRADEAGTTVIIDFEESYTASGDYYLNLPEGSLTVNGQRLLPLTLRFNIAGDIDSFYNQITIDPAEGEVEKLQYFTISFPQYVGEIAEGSKATLANTTTNKNYRGEIISVGYTAVVYFADEITDPGNYTLTIPAGAVVFYMMDETVHELNFDYSIAGDTVPSFYDQITIDPAEGRVESLQYFTLTFPMEVDYLAPDVMAMLTNNTTGTTIDAAMSSLDNKVYVNTAEVVTEPGRYTLNIPVGAVIIESLGEMIQELNFNYVIPQAGMPDYTINPPEGEVHLLQVFTIAYSDSVTVDEEAIAILSNDETGEAFECNMWEIDGKAIIYKEYPLSVEGSYTLTVPAGCITVVSTGQTNPEMVFHYTLVEKETYVPPVIEQQPAGELKMYMRTGGIVKEVEKEYQVPEGESPYELVYEQQEGALSIVYAPENKVYIQRPVSWSYYDGWIEGTLSEDGKTITVPMGQYIAYAKSLEMAVQVAMFSYDESLNSYVYDPSVEELTYTINDDGSVTQNGTNEYHILGTMNRVFGDVFQYLDYEWLQSGDYASVYIPAEEQPITPPANLVTEDYYLTTCINDGMDWDPYSAVVAIGFDGDDVWLRGISQYLPGAWIKGVRDGNKVTFPNPQLLGSYEILLYFKCADYDPITGIPTQKDMVLTMDENGVFTTFDYVFITTDKDNLYFVNYYQGLTLSKNTDTSVYVPEDLDLVEYTFSYKTKSSIYESLVEGEHKVKVGFFNDFVYIQGLWDTTPQAWVFGRMVDGKLVMDVAQFMGTLKDEYSVVYPLFLVAFDPNTGRLLPQVTFDFNAEDGSFFNASSPLSIGINKTGYLSLQDYFECVFTPEDSGVNSVVADDAYIVGYYDLQGRRFDQAPDSGIYIVKYSDGTARKVLKK